MRKNNIPMFTACILLCLTLVTTYMTSGLYAKYTYGEEMYDDARVAKFKVTDLYTSFSQDMRFDIAPGADYRATVSVTNSSEVAINYNLIVENVTDNIPLTFAISDDGGQTFKSLPYSGLNMAPGNTTAIFILKVEFNDENAMDYMGMVDLININLKAEQID